MRVYALDEKLKCTCGHTWEEHHHGVVMNSEYYNYPLTIRGCIAQECEHNQRYGYFKPRKGEKTMCECPGFKPRAANVKKIVTEWNKKHDALRKQNNEKR